MKIDKRAINKSWYFTLTELELMANALKYDIEENGDDKDFTKAELEADLRLCLKGKL